MTVLIFRLSSVLKPSFPFPKPRGSTAHLNFVADDLPDSRTGGATHHFPPETTVIPQRSELKLSETSHIECPCLRAQICSVDHSCGSLVKHER